MRRRVRLAVWGSVLALHGGALAATAWVQWRLAHAAPEVLVTVAPPPPAPPRAAAPQQRAQPRTPARTATPLRRSAAAQRSVAVASRVAAPRARRVKQHRPVRVQATACVVENAALPPSEGSPAGTAPHAAASGTTLPDREAAPLPGCPQPNYPRAARRAGHTGLVLLRVHLDQHGNVLAVLLERSSGHPALDHAARDAVLQWRFAPRIRAGTAVPCELQQPVSFRLQ